MTAPLRAPITQSPDPSVLPAFRAQIEQAQDKLRTACQILRENGWPETADELMKTTRVTQVWTQKDGWLDWLGKDGPK